MPEKIDFVASQAVVLGAAAPVTAGAAVAIVALLIGAAAGLILGRRHGRSECAALEARLARCGAGADELRQRLDLVLASPGVTAFIQDRDLALTWAHNPRPGLVPGPAATADGPDPDASPATELQRRALATGAAATGRVTVGRVAAIGRRKEEK